MKEVQKIYGLSDLDISQIEQPAVKSLIETHIRSGMNRLEDIESTYNNQPVSDYRLHFRKYSVAHSLEKTWSTYTQANPSEAWNGKILSFGVLVSKQSKQVLYRGSEYEGGFPGQVIYLHLNFLGGKIKLAVAHEIIGIDHQQKEMRLSYVKGAETDGMQLIRFKALCPNTTTIEHSTYYKGKSKFRDLLIYPAFHTMVVNEYHKNMRALLRKTAHQTPL